MKKLVSQFNFVYLWKEHARLKKEVEHYQYMVDECEQEIHRLNEYRQSTLSVPSLSESDPYLELKVGKNVYAILKNSETFHNSFVQLRDEIEHQLGLILPDIHFSTSEFLDDQEYEVYIKGVSLVKTDFVENKILAVSTPLALNSIKGIPAEPDLVGAPSWWIDETDKEEIESIGYYCLNLEEIILTILKHVFDTHLHQFVDRAFTLTLFDECDYNWASQSELDHFGIRPFTLQQVLQELLKQKVSIHNISMIFESIIQFRNHQPVEHFPLYEVVTYVKQQLGNK